MKEIFFELNLCNQQTNLMTIIVAQKTKNGKTITRKFTKTSWDLLKQDKNGLKDGWSQVTDTQVVNSTIKAPATGNAAEIKVTDLTNASKKDEKQEEKEKADEVKVLSQEDKDAFIKNVLGDITVDSIKNYFDAVKPDAYTSKDKLPALKIILAEHLAYSEEAFKEEF